MNSSSVSRPILSLYSRRKKVISNGTHHRQHQVIRDYSHYVSVNFSGLYVSLSLYQQFKKSALSRSGPSASWVKATRLMNSILCIYPGQLIRALRRYTPLYTISTHVRLYIHTNMYRRRPRQYLQRGTVFLQSLRSNIKYNIGVFWELQPKSV